MIFAAPNSQSCAAWLLGAACLSSLVVPHTRADTVQARFPAAPRFPENTFTRMFPTLHSFGPQDNAERLLVEAIGAISGIVDAGDIPGVTNPRNPDNPAMTAGFTFLGQFLDHDITFDKRSAINATADPYRTINFRTPAFDLDSVYGMGPDGSPEYYQSDQVSFRVEPIPGSDKASLAGVIRFDHPRDSNNNSIIPESRNDENLMVSQLHLGFMLFHNAVVANLRSQPKYKHAHPRRLFKDARQIVTYHYQWIIVHQFLPTTIGQNVVDSILQGGLKFYNPLRFPFQLKQLDQVLSLADDDQFGSSAASLAHTRRTLPLVPIEFSVAAYRFGHSQVRPGYRANFGGPAGVPPAFAPLVFNNSISPTDPDPNDLRGTHRAARRFIDWQTFFPMAPNLQGSIVPLHNKKIDTNVSSPLFNLPGQQAPLDGLPSSGPSALPARNLARHVNFAIPSGQAIASFMGETPLVVPRLSPFGLNTSTPLWYYCLFEAETTQQGERLGPVCGRIVGEVFIGLLKFDRNSYFNLAPHFVPFLPSAVPGNFTISDLLTFAGVVFPLGL
ncbi:myeloperoxidase thyroid peroxidase [Polychytrium aggregatum]|uniref:myeloperoxidase thyroid peroxidase n=1 Tax=Polychytrium aggregatum TaxID=110093 RepID=UPI0022FF2C53|nr:myeloperoxidase thyroid peroxidase [Polychytrium aggregatum]XP_052967427.1 myeloperoxidase thyroid peroxidase [Polychytrium aggregatum]KAI9203565.1 myeloperoxidase thyroid peroxidase [Polychytrium aggregatum]KAI9205347.1 myeloperoxidase thyroid peroxidase [Polychytrium aggregatum]